MLKLENTLRSEFKKPLGKLYSSFDDAVNDIKIAKFLISVGDATTKNLVVNDIFPNISIIDNLIQRKIHNYKIIYTNNILRAKNPPGTITENLWETIEKAFTNSTNVKNQLIIVDGEEDLAVLPCIIMAPDESVVLYGQPNEGLVFVDVNSVKNKAGELVKSLKKINNINHRN
ncbi:MAG: GTP-dependent dephospho-CoA kinase family protein [Methanobacteriaceae archaeon]|nr:GTP-dependent dephospho-CoA kinase family protein [Candidatus Methanorudis spinitermitis]